MLDEARQRGLTVVRDVLADQVEHLKDNEALAGAQIDQLGLDSLVKLDLVLQLETEFSTMANENDVAECATIGALVEMIARSSAQA